MYEQLLSYLQDIFGKIVIKVKNLNLAQKGEVIFDFQGKQSINVGEGMDVAKLQQILSTPGAITIDGANLIDGSLDASLKLQDRTINEVKVELGAIKDDLINSLADIDGSKFKAGTIVADKLYAGSTMALRISALNLRTDQAVITGTAQIQDAIITDAKISSLSVVKLTSGSITSQNITLAGTGYIRSSNYVAGSTGWNIGSDGSAEFSNVTARGSLITGTAGGQRIEITGNAFRAYSSSNTLRLQSNGNGFRFTDSSVSYNTDIEGWNYSTLPALKVGGAIRLDAIAGNLSTLNVFLHGGQLSFRDISNSLSGVVLSSTNDDTLVVQGTTITLNGKNLYSNGTDLFWNGVKIN